MADITSHVSDLQKVLAGVGEGTKVEFVAGTLARNNTTGVWTVYVRGMPLPAIWLDSVNPIVSGSVLCAVTSATGSQGTAWVLGTTSSVPSAGEQVTVTVVPSGGTTATVTCFGQTLTAKRVSTYTPVVGDVALAVYRAGVPYLIGAITAAPAANVVITTGPAAPPPATSSGYSTYSIIDSGTWSAGYNWNSYYGKNCFTGSGYIPPSSGNWFYGGATLGLADKTNITKVQFWLGSRRPAGSWNAPVTVHFYVHNANSRGGGEPSRISGPFDVTVAAHWPGGWVTLPTSVGTSLKSGGGLSIAGDPYAGFTSGPAEPNAGSLYIDWSY